MTTVNEHITQTLSYAVLEYCFDDKSGQEVLQVLPEALRDVVKIIKTELFYNMLLDIVAIDWQKQKENRFELIYLFKNIKENKRVSVRVVLPDSDKPSIVTITDIFSSADWAEREAYDMMGIKFEGHPCLERLLMWDAFEGHPLRKDYPLDKRQKVPETKEVL